MPYPAKITRDRVIEVAAQLVRRHDSESITLGDVADALGVRTPSLYRYFDNKTALLRAVNLQFLEGLMNAMHTAMVDADDPQGKVMSALLAYRAYAHESPRSYLMAFAAGHDDLRPDEELLVRMVLPFQALFDEIAGPADALTALRGAFALAHGFVLLELYNQLRRGGDLQEAYRRSVAAYLHGWEAGRRI